ncbi:DUF885 domain-containing protein [Arenimonas donghaensis]|uniref:DUF885 domain-containing protein n=1 Tax=Arenimonas donghaensis DSM 18148 = HO3-R19 TaxID=1121014 RepID=A0A087MKM9_9GAMM|nr:DUF885 domain-containing protein [Arenimonas donghaensis]KFL37432.1 hypothetical protein N788_09570 [Arenimonas donghaensis DSM 18148 = HO3-R19]
MKTLFKFIAWALLAVLLAATGLGLHTAYGKPLKIGWFYERVFIEYALDDPELLTSLGMLPPWLNWYGDELSDRSPAQARAMQAKLREDLATLRDYDRGDLDPGSQLSYDILEYFLAIQQDGERFYQHNYPLNQLFGVQSELPSFMAAQHGLRSRGDADDYVARLRQFPVMAEQVLAGLHEREQAGILPPTFVVEKVLAEMRAFIGAAPTDNILYTSFDERLAKLDADAVAPDEREDLLKQVRSAVAGQVYPAYQRFIDYYAGLLPKTRGNHGVWALPEGEAFYAWSVRMHTSTDMTPAQVHQLGLDEVARLEAEMDAILVGEGLVEGSIGERVQQIATRPDQLYPDTDEGRAAIIADFTAIIEEIDAGLDGVFNVRPRQGVEVERVPEFREKTAPGAYYQPPAFDGSRPGKFFINLRNTAEVARFGMRTLAYHEAIPGHHFQTTIQQELTGVPTFRKVLPFTAFSEGWALYTEQLAWELGFQDEPLDNLGRLQGEMMRAVRLVVDTGLHDKRWTREQAIAYMLEKAGMPETDVVAEIERYLVMPGQALAYKVGMNRILALRERAKTRLGDRFDLAAFHDLLLTGGDLPLSLLEQRVDAWIKAQAGK